MAAGLVTPVSSGRAFGAATLGTSCQNKAIKFPNTRARPIVTAEEALEKMREVCLSLPGTHEGHHFRDQQTHPPVTGRGPDREARSGTTCADCNQ